MRRKGHKSTLMLLLILSLLSICLAIAVHAAGSSEGGSRRTSATTTTTLEPQKTCEDHSSIRERVKCRLEDREAAENDASVPEACRVLTSTAVESCQTLYRDVLPCYKKLGTERDRCFKQVAGFSASSVRDEAAFASADSRTHVRNYMITLLYDLEERVEDSHADGRINSDDAADLIASIVRIKQLVLQGKPRAQIAALLADLRQRWDEKM